MNPGSGAACGTAAGQRRHIGIMAVEPRQLTLDLAHRPALGAEDFLVSRANTLAVDLIDGMAGWPHGAALVCGPAGSGKSHLASVWRHRTGAAMIAASAAGHDAAVLLEQSGALVVEDLDLGIADEQALFHLLNLCRQGRGVVLATSQVAAGLLDIRFPDLNSRIRALPQAVIEAPDDALLKAVLVKQFSDRQLLIEPAVVDYLVARIERSMAAARLVVAEIDGLALAMQRRVTRQLAGAALDRLARGDASGQGERNDTPKGRSEA
ncbi:MAG: hypothetical protein NW205_08825 [Hyphomicrobiaceae bacterium]|nr:hypothetical protein [Hyphomicrobiaceae bacterium]